MIARFPSLAETSREPSTPGSAALAFLAQVARDPLAAGAIAPSSRRLARAMIRLASVDRAAHIIELGPGTGVVTREILQRKAIRARILAIEWNGAFVRELEDRYPEVLAVQDCASRVAIHARRHGFPSADSILSALPWTIFEPKKQTAILRAAAQLLAPRGVFATVTCFGLHLLPSGREFRRRLASIFPHVRQSPVILRNVPPAFVYYCSKEG